MADIAQLEQQIRADIAAASDEAALEAARVTALGRNGSVTALLKTLGTLSPEERRIQGPLINGLKDRVNAALAGRRDALKRSLLEAWLNTESVDVTLPVRETPAEAGRVHPITQVVDELTAIFADMGFAVAEGPDIETDDYNFTKLNFPLDHPARDMHDTFFFNPKPDGTRLLLRTHTSPVQVRTMLTQKRPIRVIIPGRTYRCDSDQTHTPMFHQVEGLVIDRSSWKSSAKHSSKSIASGCASARRSSPSPSRRSKSTSSAAARRAKSASARAAIGWRFWAAAWCIPMSCEIAASILTSIKASPGAWVSIASPC
jgi:phenylalanyl-tRNA synthetase alpha chain